MSTEIKTEQQQQPQQQSLRDWLLNSEAAKRDLAALANGLMSGERLVNVVYQCIRKTPDLLQCTPAAIMGATKTLILMGCEPDGVNGYLVPVNEAVTVNGKKQWYKGCMPVPSARGLMRMAKNNGVQNINVGTVREGEPFKWGIKDGYFSAHHLPNWADKKAKVLAYYVTWTDKADKSLHGELMTKDEVDAIRKRSKAANNGPWVTDYEQMAYKTVIKRASKMWPLPYEATAAMNEADTAEFAAMRNVTNTAQTPALAPAPEPEREQEPAALPNAEQNQQVWDVETTTAEQPELIAVPEQPAKENTYRD